MTFHALDLIIYIALGILLFIALPREFKYEAGIIMGAIIILVYTAIYLWLFAFSDYNWTDIIDNIINYFSNFIIVW